MFERLNKEIRAISEAEEATENQADLLNQGEDDDISSLVGESSPFDDEDGKDVTDADIDALEDESDEEEDESEEDEEEEAGETEEEEEEEEDDELDESAINAFSSDPDLLGEALFGIGGKKKKSRKKMRDDLKGKITSKHQNLKDNVKSAVKKKVLGEDALGIEDVLDGDFELL